MLIINPHLLPNGAALQPQDICKLIASIMHNMEHGKCIVNAACEPCEPEPFYPIIDGGVTYNIHGREGRLMVLAPNPHQIIHNVKATLRAIPLIPTLIATKRSAAHMRVVAPYDGALRSFDGFPNEAYFDWTISSDAKMFDNVFAHKRRVARDQIQEVIESDDDLMPSAPAEAGGNDWIEQFMNEEGDRRDAVTMAYLTLRNTIVVDILGMFNTPPGVTYVDRIEPSIFSLYKQFVSLNPVLYSPIDGIGRGLYLRSRVLHCGVGPSEKPKKIRPIMRPIYAGEYDELKMQGVPLPRNVAELNEWRANIEKLMPGVLPRNNIPIELQPTGDDLELPEDAGPPEVKNDICAGCYMHLYDDFYVMDGISICGYCSTLGSLLSPKLILRVKHPRTIHDIIDQTDDLSPAEKDLFHDLANEKPRINEKGVYSTAKYTGVLSMFDAKGKGLFFMVDTD